MRMQKTMFEMLAERRGISCPSPRTSAVNPSVGSSHVSSCSNSRITSRNCGVEHQFIDSIGGCSSNYR